MIYQKIWQKTLNQDEKVEYEFSISQRFRMFGLIIFTIVSVLFINVGGLGILIFLAALFYYKFYLKVANAYALTNQRVIIHRGWLSTKLISIDYQKITDVTVDEPIWDRLVTQSGHLKINTAGTNLPEVVLTHLDRPYEVKKKLDQLRNR